MVLILTCSLVLRLVSIVCLLHTICDQKAGEEPGNEAEYLDKILTGVHIYAVVYHHHCPPVHNI